MAQAARRIVTELHDEPHLEGRRVTVRRLQGLVEGAGKSAQEVAAEFDLSVADVYAALQYYHTHPDEMETIEQRRRDREDSARRAGAQRLATLGSADDEVSDDVDEVSDDVPDSR